MAPDVSCVGVLTLKKVCMTVCILTYGVLTGFQTAHRIRAHSRSEGGQGQMQHRLDRGDGETRLIRRRGVARMKGEVLKSQVDGRQIATGMGFPGGTTEAPTTDEMTGQEIIMKSAGLAGDRVRPRARDHQVGMEVREIWGEERGADQENVPLMIIGKNGDGLIEYGCTQYTPGTPAAHVFLRGLIHRRLSLYEPHDLAPNLQLDVTFTRWIHRPNWKRVKSVPMTAE